MADGIHDDREGGIFIPYDKLLQQQSDKLDKIMELLRDFDKQKLDASVFQAFQGNYEERHVALSKRVSNLETDKAERGAVERYRKVLYSGAILIALNLLANIAQFWHHP